MTIRASQRFSEVVRERHVVDREAVNVKSVLVEDWFSQGFGGGLVLVLSIAVLVLVLRFDPPIPGA